MASRAAEIVLEIIRGSGDRPEPRRIDMGFSIVERASTSQAGSAAVVAGGGQVAEPPGATMMPAARREERDRVGPVPDG